MEVESPLKNEEQAVVVVEPTYRQEPEDNERFKSSRASAIAQEALIECLEGKIDE